MRGAHFGFSRAGVSAGNLLVHVSDAREGIENNGFTQVSGLFDDQQVREVERILDPLVLSGTSAPCRRELSDTPHASTCRQPEVSRPTSLAPELTSTAIYMMCHELASAIFRCRAHYLFDHAIYKMPHGGTETPWHQDLAYLGAFARHIRSLHFWIPLQDTGIEAGTMRFVAGSHRWPLLHHVKAYHDNAHVLVADTVVLQPCHVPIERGGVCIHTPLTLHGAGANKTSAIRKAWILHFGDKPRWYKHLLKCGTTISTFYNHTIPHRRFGRCIRIPKSVLQQSAGEVK